MDVFARDDLFQQDSIQFLLMEAAHVTGIPLRETRTDVLTGADDRSALAAGWIRNYRVSNVAKKINFTKKKNQFGFLFAEYSESLAMIFAEAF